MPGDDPADHIPGEIQLENPECRIHMDFQKGIPRDQPLADAVGDPQTGHWTAAAKPAVAEGLGLQIGGIAGCGQFIRDQILREVRVYGFQRAPQVERVFPRLRFGVALFRFRQGQVWPVLALLLGVQGQRA